MFILLCYWFTVKRSTCFLLSERFVIYDSRRSVVQNYIVLSCISPASRLAARLIALDPKLFIKTSRMPLSEDNIHSSKQQSIESIPVNQPVQQNPFVEKSTWVPCTELPSLRVTKSYLHRVPLAYRLSAPASMIRPTLTFFFTSYLYCFPSRQAWSSCRLKTAGRYHSTRVNETTTIKSAITTIRIARSYN